MGESTINVNLKYALPYALDIHKRFKKGFNYCQPFKNCWSKVIANWR